TYLAGHRYDGYDGHGWATRVDDTFEETSAGGGRYSPQMTFSRVQGVHVTDDVVNGRSEVRGTIEVLTPKGNLLFSRDTYLTAGLKTNVQLSWRQLDNAEFDLSGDGLGGIPLDLQQFASLLRLGSYDPNDASPTPAPSDSALAAEVERQAGALASRFLDTSWTVGPDGRIATLTVSGQVPIYDDVEAVYAARDIGEGERSQVQAGDRYEVVGLASTAPAETLRQAGQEYPAWVRDRYLQLPDTVTDRTRELAAELAAGQPSPFDTAVAIQDFLRGHITYDEQISPPPADQDVVDYVLFDSRRGYCEYYASAMAVMLRAEGIPARVAAGYFAVPYDADQDGYLYREKNAHLWVEAFFPGYGWIPFEPTASREPLQYGVPGNPPDAEPTPVPTPEPPPEPVATPAAAPTSPPPAAPDSATGEASGRILGLVGLAIGALALLGGFVAIALWQWRLRGLSPASGLWARALQAGGLGGVRPAPTLTPREYAERLGRVVPAAQGPALGVAELYSHEVYGGPSPAPVALSGARTAWAELRRATLGAVVRRRRQRGQG
ncbi:MAG TPA: transglutaminase domain-containing protein, partial [Thermomicrobiales bacterium]|nr:transglutaminase domain-containing protein [Thermomicrobiales bacterium]